MQNPRGRTLRRIACKQAPTKERSNSGHRELALVWSNAPELAPGLFTSVCPSRDADLPPPGFAEIAALYIHPASWSTGCGRALCQAALAHLRQTPAQTVTVWVLAANARARQFYERIGFAADDAKKDVTMFSTILPEIRYRQSLR
jgi:ribosomal protein S18 acetylase RimI-like enzyme